VFLAVIKSFNRESDSQTACVIISGPDRKKPERPQLVNHLFAHDHAASVRFSLVPESSAQQPKANGPLPSLT